MRPLHPHDPLAVAERLRILREALGIREKVAFARKYGFTDNQYNNIERGFPLTAANAIRLVQMIPGLSLDWLFFGDDGGLSARLRDQIAAAMDVTEAKTG